MSAPPSADPEKMVHINVRIGSEADISSARAHVCYGPEADVLRALRGNSFTPEAVTVIGQNERPPRGGLSELWSITYGKFVER
jgi:hypothetical protein